jgi:hypothetical protein
MSMINNRPLENQKMDKNKMLNDRVEMYFGA